MLKMSDLHATIRKLQKENQQLRAKLKMITEQLEAEEDDLILGELAIQVERAFVRKVLKTAHSKKHISKLNQLYHEKEMQKHRGNTTLSDAYDESMKMYNIDRLHPTIAALKKLRMKEAHPE